MTSAAGAPGARPLRVDHMFVQDRALPVVQWHVVTCRVALWSFVELDFVETLMAMSNGEQ